MGRSIIWTLEATDDFDNALTYLGRDSKLYAVRLRDEIYQRVEELLDFPLLGRSVPEINDARLRELFVGQYRILYYFESKDISILSIVHMSRDLVTYWREKKNKEQ